jgi:hypothetical protein
MREYSYLGNITLFLVRFFAFILLLLLFLFVVRDDAADVCDNGNSRFIGDTSSTKKKSKKIACAMSLHSNWNKGKLKGNV